MSAKHWRQRFCPRCGEALEGLGTFCWSCKRHTEDLDNPGGRTLLFKFPLPVNLANSRAQEVQAMCDFLIAQSRLYRAVGRTHALAGE